MNTPVNNEGTGGRDSLRHSLGGKAPSQSPERSLVEAYREKQLSGSALLLPQLPDRCGWGGGVSALLSLQKVSSVLSPCPSTPPSSLAPAHQALSHYSSAPQTPVFPSSPFCPCPPTLFKPPTPLSPPPDTVLPRATTSSQGVLLSSFPPPHFLPPLIRASL